MDYFFENLFNGLATIFTGLVAWLVYLYSKRDKKIEAANILLNEIYTAEREIKKIKESKAISDYSYILPSNHWNELQHLFVKNFDSNEINKISDFFKSCSLAEESIKLIKSYLITAMDQKSRVAQNHIFDWAEKANGDEKNYNSLKEGVLNIIHKEEYYFMPNAPKQQLFDYLQNISKLSVGSVGIKIKNIRDSRWYKIKV
ncbi:MAG: hypothetical protein WC453_01325 [Patescibacteria group bacterium]